MCDPITIGVATAALSIAGSVTEHIGQNRMYRANRDAANLNYARDQEQLGKQQVQLDKKSSENALDTAITSLQSEGTIVAGASDRGLASSSISQALNASMFGIGRQATAEDINDRSQRQNIADSRTDADIRRQSQINSVAKSGTLSLLIGVGKGAMAGVNAGKSAAKG